MNILQELRALEKWTELIPCRDGAELALIRGKTAERFEELLAAFASWGFAEQSRRKIGDVDFAILAHENHVLTCSFTPAEKKIRVFSDEAGVVPDKQGDFDKIAAPLLTQIRTGYIACDCGMSYVMRLSDGRFVIIDGNHSEYEEADHLWDVIRGQTVTEGKPVIAAWFVTHPHGDHFNVLCQFMDKYGDEVVLGDLIYNFAREDVAGTSNLAPFNRLLEERAGQFRVVTPRAGYRFEYADASFDILYTCDDLYPSNPVNTNATSIVMMMEYAGRRVLWLGDSQTTGSVYVAERYPAEVFKCEFLQIGHHGYGGGCEKLYRDADPEILLWPCPDYWYPVVSLWKPNGVLLVESQNVRANFIGGQQEVTFDMTQPVEPIDPYRHVEDGETVYEENFTGNRVYDLGWNCVCGGKQIYTGARFTLNGDSLTMENHAEKFTNCQFVQRGQMDLLDDFTLTFTGRLEEGAEHFGLYWNYPNHTVLSVHDALWLRVDGDGSFDFKLVADSKTKTVTLTNFGETVWTAPYEKRYDSGLYFLLRNATVHFKHVKLVKGA